LYKQPDTWEDFLEYSDVGKLVNVFFRGKRPAARIFLLGFGLDPATLKPEVLATVLIDWDVVCDRRKDLKLVFNWEVQSKLEKRTRHQWAKLSRGELIRQAVGGLQSIEGTYLDVLPAGAACMRLTAFHYEFLLNECV
jgi:hypothetical protein